jgi:hypothetical protein
MVKGKRLPDTEFEKFLSCPSELSAMDKKDATHMKKPQNIVYNTLVSFNTVAHLILILG